MGKQNNIKVKVAKLNQFVLLHDVCHILVDCKVLKLYFPGPGSSSVPGNWLLPVSKHSTGFQVMWRIFYAEINITHLFPLIHVDARN